MRLNLEDEEMKTIHATNDPKRNMDGLQGQGEEITLTDNELVDLQDILDHPASQTPSNGMRSKPMSPCNIRAASGLRNNFPDDFVNMGPKRYSQGARQNRSIPRKLIIQQPGRNMQNRIIDNRSFINQPYGIPPAKVNMHGVNMKFPNNMGNQMPGSLGGNSNNAEPSSVDILKQKAWNSDQRKGQVPVIQSSQISGLRKPPVGNIMMPASIPNLNRPK